MASNGAAYKLLLIVSFDSRVFLGYFYDCEK